MAPGEHEALGPARFCFTREGLRAERLEGREGLDQQLERLLEAAPPGGDAAQVRGGERDADRVVRRPPDSLGLHEQASASSSLPWSERISPTLFCERATLTTSPTRPLSSPLRR